jgi:predicted nucleotidyltransferase
MAEPQTAPPPSAPLERLSAALERETLVVLARVFGSYAAGSARAGSDLDLAVVFSSGRDDSGRLAAALADRLQREVRGPELHLVDLSSAPPLLAYEIMTRGLTLICRSPGLEEELRLWAVKRHWDNRRIYEARRRMLRERAGLEGG